MTHQFSDNIVNPNKLNDRIYYGYDGNVELTGDGYVQIPAGTNADRPIEPEVGMVRYNTTSSEFEGYGGSGWSALAGGSSTEYINYFYDGFTLPTGTVANSGRLGRNYGTMFRIDSNTQPATLYGSTASIGDPTLNYLTFDPSSGRFSGFLTEATYLINTSFEIKNDGTGAGTLTTSIYHTLEAKSGSDLLTSGISTYVKLPDSVYGGASYTPWDQTVNMSAVAKFTDGNPQNNYVQISLDSNQSQYYHVTYGFVSFIRIA